MKKYTLVTEDYERDERTEYIGTAEEILNYWEENKNDLVGWQGDDRSFWPENEAREFEEKYNEEFNSIEELKAALKGWGLGYWEICIAEK